MKHYAVHRSIDAPTETVWRLLTDASGYPTWNSAVLSVEGAIAEGQTIKLVSIVNPKRAFSLRVSDVDAPRRMVWSDGMPLGLFRGVRTFELDPEGEGSVRFSMKEVYSGPLAPLIVRTIPDMTDSFEQFADGLKAAAEATTDHG
jgi:hypothetical protein